MKPINFNFETKKNSEMAKFTEKDFGIQKQKNENFEIPFLPCRGPKVHPTYLRLLLRFDLSAVWPDG